MSAHSTGRRSMLSRFTQDACSSIRQLTTGKSTSPFLYGLFVAGAAEVVATGVDDALKATRVMALNSEPIVSTVAGAALMTVGLVGLLYRPSRPTTNAADADSQPGGVS